MTSHNDAAQVILDLHVAATVQGMDSVHAALAACWTNLEDAFALDARWRDEFSLAVAEIAANIIQHSHDEHAPLVEFTLSVMHFPNRLTARFVDRGIAITIPATNPMPPVTEDVALISERGRGLALVEITTDSFECRRTAAGENIWTIEKFFPGAEEGTRSIP